MSKIVFNTDSKPARKAFAFDLLQQTGTAALWGITGPEQVSCQTTDSAMLVDKTDLQDEAAVIAAYRAHGGQWVCSFDVSYREPTGKVRRRVAFYLVRDFGAFGLVHDKGLIGKLDRKVFAKHADDRLVVEPVRSVA